MHQPSPFEHLLASDSARHYMVKRLSAKRAWAEATGSIGVLCTLLGDDMTHFHELRRVVAASLSLEAENQATAATRWKAFLKPRIEVLEYWSSAIGASASFGAGAFAVMSVLADRIGHWKYLYLIAAGVLAAFLALKKLELDRHRCWYKYLVSHLEAIEKGAAK